MAGRQRPPMKSESFIIIGDAPPVPVKSLSREEWAKCEAKMMENVGKVMSDYYTLKLAQMLENG